MEEIKKNEIGKIYLCRVESISKNFFEVSTPNEEKGIVYIKEISDYFVNNLNDVISVGDILYLTLKGVNENGILNFSFKERRTHYLRTPFEFQLHDTQEKNQFQNLFEFTNKEIKKWKK